MKYGRIKSYEDHGNGVTAEKVVSYKDDVAVDSRKRFEERKRVKSLDESEKHIESILERIRNDTTLLDPAIRYIGRALYEARGSFDIVFEYTTVDNDKQ